MAKYQVGKISSWQNGKNSRLIKWQGEKYQVDKMVKFKLTNWQADKIVKF